MSLPYRPNVCMLVYNSCFELFLGQRLGEGVWQFPQGGVSRKLTPEETVLKELEEELGVDRAAFGVPHRLEATHQYDFTVTPLRWKDRWRGQSQTFWAVPFLGEDGLIAVERDEHPEFSAWCWCPAEAILERVDPVRKAGYVSPVLEFIRDIRPVMPSEA